MLLVGLPLTKRGGIPLKLLCHRECWQPFLNCRLLALAGPSPPHCNAICYTSHRIGAQWDAAGQWGRVGRANSVDPARIVFTTSSCVGGPWQNGPAPSPVRTRGWASPYPTLPTAHFKRRGSRTRPCSTPPSSRRRGRANPGRSSRVPPGTSCTARRWETRWVRGVGYVVRGGKGRIAGVVPAATPLFPVLTVWVVAGAVPGLRGGYVGGQGREHDDEDTLVL